MTLFIPFEMGSTRWLGQKLREKKPFSHLDCKSFENSLNALIFFFQQTHASRKNCINILLLKRNQMRKNPQIDKSLIYAFRFVVPSGFDLVLTSLRYTLASSLCVTLSFSSILSISLVAVVVTNLFGIRQDWTD